MKFDRLVHGDCYHPIYNRYSDFGADQLDKDKDGWYRISRHSIEAGDIVVTSLYSDHAFLVKEDEVLYKIKCHYTLMKFRFTIPDVCRDKDLEVWERGINVNQRVFNLLDADGREATMAELTKHPKITSEEISESTASKLLTEFKLLLGFVSPEDRIRNLVKAAALLSAEVDRLVESMPLGSVILPPPVEPVEPAPFSKPELDPFAKLKLCHWQGGVILWRNSSGDWVRCRRPTWKYPIETYKIQDEDEEPGSVTSDGYKNTTTSTCPGCGYKMNGPTSDFWGYSCAECGHFQPLYDPN